MESKVSYTKAVKFSELPLGCAFTLGVYNATNQCLFMVMSEIQSEDNLHSYNAVNLISGTVYKFCDDVDVIPRPDIYLTERKEDE